MCFELRSRSSIPTLHVRFVDRTSSPWMMTIVGRKPRSRDDISTRYGKADDTREGKGQTRKAKSRAGCFNRGVSFATRDDDAPRVSRSTVRPNSRPCVCVCVCVCMYGPTYNAANNAGTARATFAFSIDARSTCHVRTGPGVRSIVDRSILGDLDLLI